MMEKVNIPEGVSGAWSVTKFTVSERDAQWHNLRENIKGMGRCINAGEYTELRRGGVIVMSDTPAEMNDHRAFIRKATGSVLINGLGLGMCLMAVLAKQDVTDITVVELNQDVLNLVAPYYKDPRLTIVHESAFDYKPPKGKHYDAVWHDIWDFISTDNIEEMKRLHRKYARRAAWQGSWCRYECEAIQRRERRMYG